MNDLALEWKKFPKDYAQVVEQFYSYRKQSVLTWNPADLKTRQIVEEDYVDGIVKAIELVYSPAYSFTYGGRKKWIRRQVEQSEICQIQIYDHFSAYKKVLLRLYRKKLYSLSMAVMHLKIMVEKRGLDRMSNKYK